LAILIYEKELSFYKARIILIINKLLVL